MSDWSKLVGIAVNGAYPLRRYLGGSNHSVVFLTESAKHGRAELALKLVPAVPALAQLQLARWKASAGFNHPHLIQIFDAGQCQLGDRPFLYVVSDYADQNLAQLLERRALTEDEAREMLGPVLGALSFLHTKNVVQGRLKPSNVLVVGDQIKIASDTIRPVSETGSTSNVTSVYMPPEARDGVRTGASDVWALGVTLTEALTRQQPTGLYSGDMLLPPALSSAFRGVIARCVSRRARDRPTVNELQVWARGAQMVASLSASGKHAALPDAAARADVEEVVGAASSGQPAKSARQSGSDDRAPPPPGFSMGLVIVVILAALALFVMVWMGVRSPSARSAPAVPDAVVDQGRGQAPALVQTASESPAPNESKESRDETGAGRSAASAVAAGGSSAALISRPTSGAGSTTPGGAAGSARVTPPFPSVADESASPAVNEVLPTVSQRARQSIRGRVSVSVRLIVDSQGKVFAALVDQPGPSRYFERQALEAAQQWTFPPAASAGERLMRVRFEFTRQGTTARVAPVK